MASSPHRIPQFASSLSNRPSLTEAVDQVGVEIKQALTGPATHAVFFVSHAFADDWDDLAARLGQRIGTDQIIGCSGEGVIGVGNEIEEGPGLAVWAGQLPHADIVPLRLQFERTPEGGAIVGWPDSLIADWPEDGTLLLLADPFGSPDGLDVRSHSLAQSHAATSRTTALYHHGIYAAF